MANLVIKDKALAKLQEPEMRMGRYYPPNDALMQILQAMQLCVEAIGLMSRRTRVETLYGGVTSHSSVIHIVAELRPSVSDSVKTVL
jgi:hypothetical protein